MTVAQGWWLVAEVGVIALIALIYFLTSARRV
jgi:hypothetical protein